MSTVANKTKTENTPSAASAIPETAKSNVSGQAAFALPVGAPSGNAAGAVQMKANPNAASFGQIVAQRSESGEMEEEEIQMKPTVGNFSQTVAQRSAAPSKSVGAHSVSPMPLQLKTDDEKYLDAGNSEELESNEESKEDNDSDAIGNMPSPLAYVSSNTQEEEQESTEESKEDEGGSVARDIQAAPVPIAAGNAQEQESTEENKEEDNGNAYAGNVTPIAINSGGNAEDIKNDGNLEEAESQSEAEERKELY